MHPHDALVIEVDMLDPRLRSGAPSSADAARHPRGTTGGAVAALALGMLGATSTLGCAARDAAPEGPPTLRWYVYDEQSGSFAAAAERCTERAAGRYAVQMVALPADASQQREQLVRRLAARDPDIDLIGMDVIWTAELAAAGWIRPWGATEADEARAGRIDSALESASWGGRLWAVPFNTNTQLLWYRSDRVDVAPSTWDQMIDRAETLGEVGTIEGQGARYEGLTVFFVSLLASAGGAVLEADGQTVSLESAPTRRALEVMRAYARSPAAPTGLATNREDDARLAFEAGGSSFMLNYTYVWPSARANVPELAEAMSWARWPRVVPDRPSRVTLGGINVGVGAHTRYPELAFEAASCIADRDNQLLAARKGGLPPTIAELYESEEVKAVFPFADVLLETLRDGVQRPQTPLYADVSLAIAHVLHPMRDIDPEVDLEPLREAVQRALDSRGLL